MSRAERQREAIRGRRFGVELELVRITRPAAARIVHDTLVAMRVGGAREPWSAGGHYDKWCCQDAQGRIWTCMSDASVASSGGASWSGHCEVVTPPLRHEDMPVLQAIVRALRQGGAKVNTSCGLHVHVEAVDLSGPQLRTLQLLWSRWEEHFMLAANVHPERLRYCGRSSSRFVRSMRAVRPDSLTPEAVRAAWYDRPTAPRRDQLGHYDGSRYVALNFHALTWHGTVELRLWNGTLHAGAVRAAVVTSVALVACALTVQRAHGNPVPVTPQSAGNFRQFLLRGLGLTGEENVAVVKHLLAPLAARGMRVQGWERLPAGAGRRGPSQERTAQAEASPETGMWSAAAEVAQYAEPSDGIQIAYTTIRSSDIADNSVSPSHLRMAEVEVDDLGHFASFSVEYYEACGPRVCEARAVEALGGPVVSSQDTLTSRVVYRLQEPLRVLARVMEPNRYVPPAAAGLDALASPRSSITALHTERLASQIAQETDAELLGAMLNQYASDPVSSPRDVTTEVEGNHIVLGRVVGVNPDGTLDIQTTRPPLHSNCRTGLIGQNLGDLGTPDANRATAEANRERLFNILPDTRRPRRAGQAR